MNNILITAVAMALIGSVDGIAAKRDRNRQIVPEVRYELSGGAGRYDYAPSFIIDEYGIIYGFLCENSDPFKIVDYIYLYKGIPTPDGYVWQPGTPVLAPSAVDVTQQGWDTHHVCDPDVRQFRTRYKGETYDWIMTYLGVDQWDCNHNQIGLAVSKNIEGPWIKFDGNPLIPYAGRDKWGTGQSTTIVKDSATVTIFYHSTTENGPYCARDIKLDNLDDIQLGDEYKVPYLTANSYPAVSGDRIYMVSEMWTSGYENVVPTWVGDMCRVSYKTLDPSKSLIENVVTPDDEWITLGAVTPEISGFPRSHNPGFLTDTRGYLPFSDKIVVYYTPAITGENWLWSYDLYSATFKLK